MDTEASKRNRIAGNIIVERYEMLGLLAVLTLLYAPMVLLQARRILWYDELFTYYIAKASTVQQLLRMARTVDLNPPEVHLITRGALSLFGDTRLGARFPSIVEFYVASIFVFLYVKRIGGSVYAAVAVLLIWSGPAFYYATEARPYALLLAAFTTILFCRDSVETRYRTFAILGMWVGNCVMLLAHVLAPFSLLPFLAAEAVTVWKKRKLDYAVWAALLLPMVCTAVYVPLFSGFDLIAFPPAFQAAPRKVVRFFQHAFLDMSVSVELALLAALVVAMFNKTSSVAPGRRTIRFPELALFVALLCNPAMLVLSFMRVQGVFWDRYAITTTVAIAVSLAMVLAFSLHFQRASGYAAALMLVCTMAVSRILLPLIEPAPRNDVSALAKVSPDLPLVAASGLVFLAMDHEESAELVSRLFYLEDHDSAMQFAHATIFERMDMLKASFPIRGNVDQFNSFVRRHREFLVFGSPEPPEDWLMRKLAKSGATITPMGTYSSPYRDSTLYKVSVQEP
jgi:hypothetical protein